MGILRLIKPTRLLDLNVLRIINRGRTHSSEELTDLLKAQANSVSGIERVRLRRISRQRVSTAKSWLSHAVVPA